MCQNSKKRVYNIGQTYSRQLSATDNHVKEFDLEEQFLLFDGLFNDQQAVEHNYTLQSDQKQQQDHHVIAGLHGFEQYQVLNQIDQEPVFVSHNSSRSGKGDCCRRKRSVLSEEEKKERKRLSDSKYRHNKKMANEKLKDEVKMLRNRLQASGQGKETSDHQALISIHGAIQDLGSDRNLSDIVAEEEPPRILEENHQSLTCPGDQDNSYRDLVVVTHKDVQSDRSLEGTQPITYCQDGIQTALSDVLHSDACKSSEESQLLMQPQLFPAYYLTFMEKLEKDEKSNVSYSDFKTFLQGETQEMGGYRIPLPLQPYFEKIITSYGGITSNSVLSSFSAENVLLQLLATIKEMGDTAFEQVTEELIFKWRDCIGEAKRIRFNVTFATEHLKKIARSYLGRRACNELRSFDERIEVLETELNRVRREKLEKLKTYSSQLLAASQDFPRTVGLF